MATTKANAKLVDSNIKNYIKNPCVKQEDIGLVISQAWSVSFAWVQHNKKALVEPTYL